MEYRERQPSRRLAGHIKRFWSLAYDPVDKAAGSETVLPDGCPEIIFNLSDRFRRIDSEANEIQPATLFAGQMSRSIAIQPTGTVQLFGVRFHPAGAFPLGGFSMHELTDQIIGIDCALGREGLELEARIWEAKSFEQRTVAFEAFFLERLAARQRNDAISNYAAGLIFGSDGLISVSHLSERLGVSERRLERRFKACVGVSPKMLARIVRFQGVVRKIQSAETPNMLDAVHELGYFDQSHLIRDFREFSGETPSGYFEKTHNISDIFTAS